MKILYSALSANKISHNLLLHLIGQLTMFSVFLEYFPQIISIFFFFPTITHAVVIRWFHDNIGSPNSRSLYLPSMWVFPTLSTRISTPPKRPAVRGEPLSAVSQQFLMALGQFQARAFLPADLTCLSLLRPKKHSVSLASLG